MMKAAAVKRKANLGTGEKRQQKKEALGGVSDAVDATPRSPEALAELLGIRQREDTRAKAPRAQQVRRLARLVRTKPAVMKLIQATAERCDPQHLNPLVVRLDGALGLWSLETKLCTPWQRVTCVLDIMPGVSDLWTAAKVWFREASEAGTHLVQQQRTELRRGRVGDVIGGLRQILTKRRLRKSVQEARAKVITCFPNHRRWMKDGGTWRRACPSAQVSWRRRAVPWSSTAWKATASGGAVTGQNPCWRGARSRRATTMISMTTGGSLRARGGLASTVANQHTSARCD